jgi:Aerotolerance regulator N-terminal/von Willebrand factor type A domain
LTPLVAAAGTAAFELLAPGGLALLALLVPLVLLYILKIRRERRKVASTWLWVTSQRDLMARSPFRRFVAQVPLVVQALALIALAVGLARPATRGRGFTGDHVAIILDASASMSALVPGPGEPVTRLDLAKRAAHDLLGALTPGSDALVLEAARDTRLLSPLDRDRVRLAAAVDRAVARDVEGDLGPAVALAVDRLRQLGGARRVVVITDGALAHPAAIQGAALPVEIITVGAQVDNAAIVRVDVRSGRSPDRDVEQVQAFLVVENFGRSPRDLHVTMREENASDVLASRRVLVQPGERLPVPLEFRPTPGDYRKGLIFEISPRDAMPADDVAYARVPAGDKLPVYLAGTSPWIERALAADPQVELRVGTVAELVQDGTVSLETFVVVDGACPEGLPGGDLLVIHPPAGTCAGTVVGAPVEHPEITSWESGDVRLRFLTLDGVHVARANLLEPEGASPRLVRARQGALITDISTSARAGTLVGFDPGESDWPLKASFVLFVRNLLEQARTHRARGITGPARAGEPMRVTLPPDATHVEAFDPSGARLEVSARGGVAVLPEITRAGLYRVTWQGPQAGATLVPANLTSAAESDLGPRPLPVEEGRATVTAVAAPDAHHEHTWILALLALGLVVFDVWYLTRSPRPLGTGA